MMDKEMLQELVQNAINDSNNLEVWIPAIISVFTLIVNLFFYIFVQPRISYKSTAKDALSKVSIELLNYLAEIVSFEDFSGVPTKIRKYSLQIHLQFKKGTADGQVELLLEEIFKAVQKRKTIESIEDIESWNEVFRNKVRGLRKELAKYCGSL